MPRNDTVHRELEATVAGEWREDEQTVSLLTAEGVREVSALPRIADDLDPGDRAVIFLDASGARLGWYLPDQRIGVREDDPV